MAPSCADLPHRSSSLPPANDMARELILLGDRSSKLHLPQKLRFGLAVSPLLGLSVLPRTGLLK
ncbi:hypothetical protein AXF42_Ash020996 [Apostasia shenzhenica]|uniref:Uncharacterized protein n=1 Tax=Apostasia shenzhenica TaxID=1088818 RepID=A0A2I0AEV5_9ASPA|nr:hypothetical protein AXF42_Ash020996 [Apostasia shenzhenica]